MYCFYEFPQENATLIVCSLRHGSIDTASPFDQEYIYLVESALPSSFVHSDLFTMCI